MIRRARALLFPAAFVLGVFVLTAVAGYVYSHEPSRDTLLVEYQGTPEPQPTYLLGAVDVVEGGTITLATASGGHRDVVVPPGTPVEVLERVEASPDDGATVNVGVDDTEFGLVLTGVVAIETAP
ncbi:MAG: hypothetical protein DWG80_02620 [Chloroflexi bacterium]|nr:hypothetical protein [Chloroflexota bacterium]